MIKVECIDKTLTITDCTGADKIQFSFCSLWNTYEKSVVFNHSTIVPVVNNEATIPADAYCFYVKGTKAGASDRKSDMFSFSIENGEVIAKNPSKDVHDELMNLIENGGMISITNNEIDSIVGV